MRRTFAGVLLALALSLGVRAAAQGGSVTDQAVSLRYGASHWSGFPAADLVGATPGDPVYQSGWWYRVFEDTREYPLGPPDSVSYADGCVTAVWTDLDGKGFRVVEEACVVDNEGPSGGYVSNLRITNLNATQRSIAVLHYVDVDLAGTSPGDSGVQVGEDHTFLKFSEGSRTLSYRAYAPQTWLRFHRVASFPTIRDQLNDFGLTLFDNDGLPFGPGDVSAGFELVGPIGPGGTYSPAVSVFADTTVDDVKGDPLGLWSYPPLIGQSGNQVLVQPMRRRTHAGTARGYSVPPGATVMGMDDFYGERLDSLVSRDLATGATYIGALPIGAPTLALNWKLSATGDFDGDGKADIVWRNADSQKIVIWTMNGRTRIGGIIPNPDHAENANWEIAAAADFTGDGNRDLLWYNQTSGRLVIWYMDGSVTRIGGSVTTPLAVGDNSWRVVAVGDFGKGEPLDGTPLLGTQDIVWQNSTSGRLVVWHMDRSARRTGGGYTTPDTLAPGFTVVGPR